MGGCVVSVLSMRNGFSAAPHKEIVDMRKSGKQSVEIDNRDKQPNESRIRRSPSMKDVTLDQMYKMFYGGEHISLAGMLKNTCAKFKTRKAIAWRTIDKIEKAPLEENGVTKQWEFIHLKPTEYYTYSQLWETVTAFGRGLLALGFTPGTKVGLYEETRMEWLVTCYGAWTQGMTGVTIYSNLGEDALEYAIKEAEIQVLLCSGKAVKNLRTLCAKGNLEVPTLIYTDALPAGADLSGVRAVAWSDVLAKGKESSTPEKLPKDPEEKALIMYTSGTTGDPKGVVMTHGNVAATILTFNRRLNRFVGEKPEDDEAYVAYLPLAHILEFAAENVFLNRGSMIGYGNPRTLTDTSAKPHGDLKEFKPTVLAGVPRVFDTIKKAVEAKLPEGFPRQVFNSAYEERRQAIAKGMTTPYWDAKVFAKPRALLGGRCKAIISGGAPMSGKLQEFLTVVFGASVGQGYGLTETCAICTMQGYWDTQTENIGGLQAACEVKLVDFEDWKHTDPNPRGEICIRGPVVTKGYYKQEEKTREAFGSDGWFHTGDVGMFLDDGSLKIIGRVKALAKNAFGEYIALDALESVYVLNDLALPNSVCLLVDSQKAYVCALVLTDENKAKKFATANGIAGTYPEFLKDPEFNKKAALSLAATAKAAGKKPFECVKYVRVLSDEWTPENGVLTAASKLKRRVVDLKYAEIIKELFKE